MAHKRSITLKQLLCCVAATGLLTLSTQAQNNQPETPAPEADPQPLLLEISSQPVLELLPQLRERLNSLDPSKPLEYLELGEELSAEAVTREDVELAQHTLALAYLLESGSRTPSPERLAGICIALAEAERMPDRAHWLRSVAEIIHPTTTTQSLATAGSMSEHAIGFRAATALGYIRSGNASQAARLLRDPAVTSIIAKNQMLLIGGGDASSLTWVQDQVRQWPCPECRNARIIRRPGNDGLETRICPWCGGDPGPTLDREQLIAQLRLESHLLEGVGKSWTAQVARDFGAPLRDPNPDEMPDVLLSRYGATIAAPFYRDGTWVNADSTTPD